MITPKHQLDLDQELVDAARTRLASRDNLDAIVAAVDRYLPEAVRRAHHAGLGPSRPDRRNRAIPARTWEGLTEAARQTALDRVTLLRACLRLAATTEDR